MDQYLRVRYTESRDVFIDGAKSGKTNKRLLVGEGPHTIHLGEPRDYEPQWRRPNVTGTTPLTPMEVLFEKC